MNYPAGIILLKKVRAIYTIEHTFYGFTGVNNPRELPKKNNKKREKLVNHERLVGL